MQPLQYKYQTRVRYKDIDAMGVVYYSRYYEFFEAARTDMLRDLGLPYSEFENRGISMPVIESKCRYLKGAKFDEILYIECEINSKPRARLKIDYNVKNNNSELIARGYTIHAFIDDDQNVRRAPAYLLELFGL